MCYGIIYKVTNLVNGKIYIGQTTKAIETRAKEHLSRVKLSKSIFSMALKKYGAENFKWETIDTSSCRDDINKKEIFWINHYNSYVGFDNCNGYNMTLGGEGSLGILQDDIVIENKSGEKAPSAKFSLERLREMLNFASSGKYTCIQLAEMYGVNKTAIHDILSKRTYKKDTSLIMSDDELLRIKEDIYLLGEKDRRKKVGDGNRGKVVPKEVVEKQKKAFKNNNNGRPLLQIDIYTRNIVARYNSITEGAEATGAHTSALSACCKDMSKTSKGFMWAYEESYDEHEIRNFKFDNKFRVRPVVQLNIKTNELLGRYNSATEGAYNTNCDRSAIVKCCKGKLKQTGGFKWIYEDDYAVIRNE